MILRSMIVCAEVCETVLAAEESLLSLCILKSVSPERIADLGFRGLLLRCATEFVVVLSEYLLIDECSEELSALVLELSFLVSFPAAILEMSRTTPIVASTELLPGP